MERTQRTERNHFSINVLRIEFFVLDAIFFLQVCKLLRHVALSESLQVSAKFTEINLRIYGPQVVTAAHTLARHPTSKIAKENLEGELLEMLRHFFEFAMVIYH